MTVNRDDIESVLRSAPEGSFLHRSNLHANVYEVWRKGNHDEWRTLLRTDPTVNYSEDLAYVISFNRACIWSVS